MRPYENKPIIIKKKHKPRSEDHIRRKTQTEPKPIRPIKHGRKLDPVTAHLPNKKRPKGFYSLGMSLVNVLTPKQWLALFILMNISSAYALKANEQIAQSKAIDDNKKLIKGSLDEEDHCEERSLAIFNKPDIRLGAKEGKLIPISCLDGDNATCVKDQNLMESFVVDVSKMDDVYTQTKIKNKEWQLSITPSLKKILAKIPEEAKGIFRSWTRDISLIKSAHHSVRLAYAAGAGTCDNHKDVALIKTFSHALKYGLKVKVQVIIVYSDETQTEFKTNIGEKRPLNGHAFLLIDSEVADVIINNDRAAVAEYLANIKTGRIQDTWNKNCRKINEDKSGFYHEAAHWNTLYIESVILDFEGLKKLPISAQRLFCQELSSAGLPVELNQTCGLFMQKSQKHREQVKSLQTQQNSVL